MAKLNESKTNEMDDAVEKFQAVGTAIDDMFRNGCSHKIKRATPVGYLGHKPTGYTISVYEPISRFKALMLRWCFGLKYKKI